MNATTSTPALVVKELDPWVTPIEAARLLRVSKQRIYELFVDQALKSTKVGSRRLVDSRSLIAYVESCAKKKEQRDSRITKMVAARQAGRAAKAAAHQQRPKLTRR